MPRMFDLLRSNANIQKERSEGQEYSKDEKEGAQTPRRSTGFFGVDKGADPVSRVFPRDDAAGRREADHNDVANVKYAAALEGVKRVFEMARTGERPDEAKEEIFKTVDALTNYLMLSGSLLESVNHDYEPRDFFPRHAVNVCILSISVGMEMHFNKSRLHMLGAAALLHDLGMTLIKDIIEQPRALSNGEAETVRRHASQGAELVSRMASPLGSLRGAIEQHHERVNGQGYPLGMRGNEIDECAKVIGLADTYEAMTHSRPHRAPKVPHLVMREVLGLHKSLFEESVVKAFTKRMSIYPVGSLVRLDNGAVAKVIASNPASPLRPIILIFLDPRGNSLFQPQTLDLARDDSICIKEPLAPQGVTAQ